MLLNLPVHQPATQPVTTLMVYLTEDCNLRCSYCFVAKKRKSMTAETADRLVDFLFDSHLCGDEPNLQINFFGGEPFLELDRMEQIIDRADRLAAARGRRVWFSATTNGTLYSERIAEVIRRSGMALLVSLDGGPDVTQEDRPFVSGRSSHLQVVKNLPGLLEATSGRLMARTTFHPGSLNLVERCCYVLQQGIGSLNLYPVIDADWEPCEAELETEYQELASWFLACCDEGIAPPLEATWRLVQAWHQAHHGLSRPHRPCPVGASLMAVDTQGNILPCQRFLYRPQDRLGSVYEPALQERSKYLSLHSSQMGPDCDSCFARPICGGGCRLVALQQGLGLTSTYSGFCIPMRAHARAAHRIYTELVQSNRLELLLGFKSPVGADLQQIFVGEG